MQSIRVKFIIYLSPLVILVSLSFLLFFVNRSTALIKNTLTEFGFSLVNNLSHSAEFTIASENQIFLRPYLDKIFHTKDVVFTAIYSKEGDNIIFNKKIETSEAIPKDVIGEITEKKKAVRRESRTSRGDEIYDFYSPIFVSELLGIQLEEGAKELAGFARVSLSQKRMVNQGRALIIGSLLITLLLILLGVGVAVVLAGRITKPLRQLTRGVEIIGKGDMSYRISIKSRDEIEALAKGFNKMAKSLGSSRAALEEERSTLEVKVRARTKELEGLAQTLEEKVKERTGELQQRIDELEKFHKLTVGRELKMIELKKALGVTEEKLKKLKGRKT